MYCARPVTRSPSTIRIVSNASRQAARNAHFFHGFPAGSGPAPFFGRATQQDPFRALDRMLEDFTVPSFPFASQQVARSQQPTAPSYQPRFDVREVDNTYELRGDLPGVDSKDLEVEFKDEQTLIVRGRSERESTSGTPPIDKAVISEKGKERITTETAVAEADAATETAADNSDAASTYSTGSYQKPSVEDEEGIATTEAAKATPATTLGETTEQQTQQPEQQAERTQPRHRYWISERSTGSFQRVFTFPGKVDQEAVTASLKNGILNIVVPKASKPEPKRIQVE